MTVRDRVGEIGSVKVRLVDNETPLEEVYQRRYLPVQPQGIASQVPTDQSPIERMRVWRITDWSQGEGFRDWRKERSGYWKSTRVRPSRVGGLVGGPEFGNENTDLTAASTTHSMLGLGQGKLWIGEDDGAQAWEPANEEWDTEISTGASTSEDITSIVDGEDTWMYSGHVGGDVHRWKSGSNEQHVATSFAGAPTLVAYDGSLYAVDVNDLYEIDKGTAETITLKVDVGGSSSEWLSNGTPWVYQRACATDVGVAWLQRHDNGDTYVWEYNVPADTAKRRAKLPFQFCFPYSIGFAFGFIFVGFKVSPTKSGLGDTYLFYQRGGQEGVLGPIRRGNNANTSDVPVLIAGAVGDELIFYAEDALWAYNVSTGGIYNLDRIPNTSTQPTSIALFGNEVFLSGYILSGAYRYELDTEEGTVGASGAQLETGFGDLDYPGIDKTFLEVTLETDALLSGDDVEVLYSVDGSSSYTSLGNHDTDGATSKTFTLSSASGTVKGRSIGFRLDLDGGTPHIRALEVRATAVASQVEWILVVRPDTPEGGGQWSPSLLADLVGLKTARAVVTFKDPWQKAETSTAESVAVTVEDVVLPPAEGGAATVRLRAVSLV